MATVPLTNRPLTFDLTWRRYRLRLARTESDLQQCLRLRHAVFLEELTGHTRSDGLDRDAFDDHCDHLLVTLADSDDIVGTCRIACSLWANRSYSGNEFELGGFLAAPGVKMEVGRTCLAKAQRNNLALAALGRGIGNYAHMVGARWLFGCSSVPLYHPHRIAALAQRMREDGATRGSFAARPRPGYCDTAVSEALRNGVAAADDQELEALLPPLLRTYLRAKAAVSAEPALDRDFECYDFLTILDLQHHNHAFLGRFVTAC